MELYTLSILAPDRTGLLRDITQVIVDHHGNIDAIRQTIVGGFFNLTFISQHPDGTTADALRQAFAKALGSDAAVSILPCPALAAPAPKTGEMFIATTRGPDKPGTIHAISDFLCQRGINIEDWLVGQEDGAILYTSRILVPPGSDLPALQADFRARMAALGLDAYLYHENIIRATNEIGPVKQLTATR